MGECLHEEDEFFRKNQTKLSSHEYDEDDWENEGGGEEANVEAGETVAGKVKGADDRTYKSKRSKH